MDDFQLIYQQYQLSTIREAYAPAIVDQLIAKFKEENQALDEETIRWYINRFDVLKGSPRLQSYARRVYSIDVPADIFKYNWQQLETVVDQQPAPEDHPSKRLAAAEETDAKLLWDKNGLKIYNAPSAKACIQLGQHEFGRTYSFCVSRDLQRSNMYDSYRFQDRSFYFVHDADRAANNPLHLLVIQATKYPDIFYITTATNTGDKQITWDGIIKMQPKLAGLQQLFKFNNYTATEEGNKVIRTSTPDVFDELSYDLKRLYISAKKPIKFDSWEDLPRDLKALYTDIASERWVPQFFAPSLDNITAALDVKTLLQRTLPQYSSRYFERINQRIDRLSAEQTLTSVKLYPNRIEFEIGSSYPNNSIVVTYTNKFDLVKYSRILGINTLLKNKGINDHYGFTIHSMYDVMNSKSSVRTYLVKDAAMIDVNDEKDAIDKYKIAISLDAKKIARELPAILSSIYASTDYSYSSDLLTQIFIDDSIHDDQIREFVQRMMHNKDKSIKLSVESNVGYGDSSPTAYAKKHMNDIGSSVSKSLAFRAAVLNAVQHNTANKYIKTACYVIDKNQEKIGIIVPITVYRFHTCLLFFDNTFNYRGYYEYATSIQGQRLRSDAGNVYYNKDRQANIPRAIILDTNSNHGSVYTEWDADSYVERERARKAARSNRVARGTSTLKKLYAQFKKELNRFDWLKRHGKHIDAVRHSRRTLIPSGWVLADSYQSGRDVLSAATYENVEKIGKTYDITWNRIFIVPVEARNAASFIIAGKNKNGDDIFFIRKETASSAAGRTFVYSTKDGGEEHKASTLVYWADHHTAKNTKPAQGI